MTTDALTKNAKPPLSWEDAQQILNSALGYVTQAGGKVRRAWLPNGQMVIGITVPDVPEIHSGTVPDVPEDVPEAL